mmetsp:Transcript_48107/g.77630  ORF Transcript_48107/g.77630 Transcript_48107/m.77630 type:complete len:141 (-) Transcript_48107:24-446(-)
MKNYPHTISTLFYQSPCVLGYIPPCNWSNKSEAVCESFRRTTHPFDTTGNPQPFHLIKEGPRDEGINALDAVGDVVELIAAIVDILKIGVHVGPGVEGGTDGRNVCGGRSRDAAVGHIGAMESAIGTLVGNLLKNTEHPD